MPRSKPTHLPTTVRLARCAIPVLLLGALGLAGSEAQGWQAPRQTAQPASPPALSLLEAVRLTLARDPNIAISRVQVESARGALKIASGLFDPVLTSATSRSSANAPVSESEGQFTTLLDDTFGWNQTFRNGTSIAPGFELNRTGTPGGPVIDTGTLSFRIRQPLLQGRGRGITDAAERSAQHGLVASELDLRFAISQRVQAVASQYWQARSAQLNLDVLISSEASAREVLANTRRLVEADETPAGELVQLEANLAAKESARIDGERSLFAARQGLGREIGLDQGEIAALPLPSDPFPAIQPEGLPPLAAAGPLVEIALRRRADLRAARERQEGLDILARAAENGLKPRLDLVFTPSYTGLKEGAGTVAFFSPLVSNIPGVSSLLSLNLTWPTASNLARGQLLQTRAAQSQNRLETDLAVKRIGADVPTALDAVRRNAQQLQRAREAVGLFERTVANEEKKLRAGTSTLINLISQRDRLTSARQVQVSAQLSLALSLLELRFQTGTLLVEEQGEVVLRQSRLTGLPSQEDSSP